MCIVLREVLYNTMMISDKMKVATEFCNLLFTTTSVILLFSGLGVDSMAYDYFSTTECMREPQRAQYGGGIIVNPGFDHNIESWTVFGNGTIEERISNDGNRFIVARNRTQSLDSFSQKIQLKKGLIYVFSGWFQLSEGSDTVSVVFKLNGSEMVKGGHVIAKNGCWSFLKGGVVANFSSSAQIHFESNNPNVEIWGDSVSLQPFTKKQWRSHQDNSIERVRKSRVRFHVTNVNKTSLEGAKIVIKPTKPNFPFGCGMNHNILNNTEYQKWFVSRFKYTTFTNEMKWYSTEKIQGIENYTIADAMVEFNRRNGISVRGHTIFWDDMKFNPVWVKTLSPRGLRKAAAKRINSIVLRYKGKVIAWDVMNENVHYRFFEDKLGENASAIYYSKAHELDPTVPMFMNEFNTIAYSGEKIASPANYVKKLKEIMEFPGNDRIPFAIGLQGHFSQGQPNLAYMRSSLDFLGATGLPIWLTETSMDPQPQQAEYFEEVLREAYSHPAVKGIIMFAGPAQAGFLGTLLADQNFTITPTGQVVDNLIHEWGTGPTHTLISDTTGIVDISLNHGDYDVTVTHPVTQYIQNLNLSVNKGLSHQNIHVKVHA
ncbi:endo-1,4-beta-xylanase 5-like [Cicer arietinum]|uniref:Endo-1,4-beta-xylanase 5-like n=1 Tax=Cicer arietinum TaxID=3827 RepID=A0A1S2Y0J5_CICAR|nr:endo-1,4-beta-xylanase 5-like [Cicer arietinum]